MPTKKMTLEELTPMILALSEILGQDIDEVLMNKELAYVDSTFVASSAISNIVGSFAGMMYEINPELVLNFQRMMDMRIHQVIGPKEFT